LYVGGTSYVNGAQILTTATVNSFVTAGVSSITAGTGTVVTTSTGAVTVYINTATLMSNAVTATYAQSFNTSTLVAQAVSASTATYAGYAYSFNTGTLVANAVNAQTVTGGVGVYTLTAGTGTVVNTSTGAVTVWFNTATLVANSVNAITATNTTMLTDGVAQAYFAGSEYLTLNGSNVLRVLNTDQFQIALNGTPTYTLLTFSSTGTLALPVNTGTITGAMTFGDGTRQATAWNTTTVVSSATTLYNSGNQVALNSNGTMSFPNNKIDVGTSTAALWSSNQSALVWRVSGPGTAGQPLQSVVTVSSGSVTIGTATGLLAGPNTAENWVFDTFGNITFPDSTVQTTAYTGYANTATIVSAAAQPNITSVGTLTRLTVSGIVTATNFVGTLTTALQPNITSVGTLTSLTSTGTITVNYTPATTVGSAILATGSNTAGGATYFDFLKVTNTLSTATNGSKSFRISATGGLEIVRSDYGAVIFTLSDAGIVQIPQGGVAGSTATSNAINLGSQGQLYSDGNVHLHSNGGQIWINALDGSDVAVNTQVTPTAGGLQVGGALKSHSRMFDWTAMIHGSPATGGITTGTILGNASYSNSSDGVQLTPNNTNQTGVVAWNASGFDFGKDFVMEWSWFTSSSGTNPADGIWAFFGGSSSGGANQPQYVNSGSIALRYLTFTNLKTQWYNNGSTTGNAVNFRAGVTYQGEWMTSRFMVRSVGSKRYAYVYTGVSGVCDNAIDITGWSPGGTWIGVGASTGGNSAGQLCCHVSLEYL